MPTGEVYARLEKMISDLSKKYSSPRFAPHVTLLGELTGSYREIEMRASRLSVNLRPHAIKLTKLEYFDEYFRSLFIRVEETDEIIEANLRAREIFNRQRDLKYMPHLSILYGDFPSATKDKIIGKIGRECPLSFEVNCLHLVETSGRPESWRTERKFPFGSTG
jgi:2'-5' RNA ligase